MTLGNYCNSFCRLKIETGLPTRVSLLYLKSPPHPVNNPWSRVNYYIGKWFTRNCSIVIYESCLVSLNNRKMHSRKSDVCTGAAKYNVPPLIGPKSETLSNLV